MNKVKYTKTPFGKTTKQKLPPKIRHVQGLQDYRFPPELTWQCDRRRKNRWCAGGAVLVGWSWNIGGCFLGCTTNHNKTIHLATRISWNVHSSREPTKNSRKWWTNANKVMTFALFYVVLMISSFRQLFRPSPYPFGCKPVTSSPRISSPSKMVIQFALLVI